MTGTGPGSPLEAALPEAIRNLADRLSRAGGRAVLVGGWVRDRLSGVASNDFDLEVFGLSPEAVTECVVPLGFTPPVGRSFPAWRNTRAGIDLAFPRAGNEAFRAEDPGSLARAFEAAARHRDLTVNAMGWDPLLDTLIDPLGGAGDLARRVLAPADPATFAADPLRVLRVARLAARLEAEVTPELTTLCRGLDLSEIAVERITGELRRMLVELDRPSEAIDWIERLGALGLFAPIEALAGVPQDPKWHPEGDVYVHTLMVLDRAAEIARPLPRSHSEILMWAALCHDLGKPATTRREGDRVRALGHEAVSARLTREWLGALRLAHDTIDAVEVLVANHLAPAQFVAQNAGARGYRRLARKLSVGGMTVVELERLARADHLGRTTEDARSGRFEAGQRFLARAAEFGIASGVRPDVVSAVLVMQRGVPAGPELGRILARCRAVQDETGWTDPDRILARAMPAHPSQAKTSD